MYRLALYSDQIIPENRTMDLRLMELIDVENPKIGYVASSPDKDKFYFTPKQTYYSDLDAELTAYTDTKNAEDEDHLENLFNCDAIHLSGGNTFFFLAWLRQTGLDKKLKEFAAAGNFLIGTSAGAILMTSSIESSLICGDDDSFSDGNHAGLALVPFNFLPHFEYEQDISTVDLSKVLTYACPDGAGIIVNGDNLEFFGEVSLLNPRPVA